MGLLPIGILVLAKQVFAKSFAKTSVNIVP